MTVSGIVYALLEIWEAIPWPSFSRSYKRRNRNRHLH